jgi:hypothetical protein
LVVGTISHPSGATMRLRPPRRWNRMGMHEIKVRCDDLTFTGSVFLVGSG